jgi:hypothetical protein
MMKKNTAVMPLALVLFVLAAAAIMTGCISHSPIKFPYGTFPNDTSKVLSDINSIYDDFNSDLYALNGNKLLIFSSNRASSGGQFDFVQGYVAYTWDQTNGNFHQESQIADNAFITKLLNAANTSGNDYGPYSLYSPTDGYEYLLYASDKGGSGLDFYFTLNRPVSGTTLPDIIGPFPATRLNSSSDDSYISLDTQQDSVYYSSASGGNFDIYVATRSVDSSLATWLGRSYRPGVKVDSVCSTGNDKCPFVYNKLMVFASDKAGGMGGFDLYYSVFKSGKWSSPVNFGPKINTQYNEYRPIIGSNNAFTNYFMIFSSDRPGGKGGYDLYFTGL